jgi:hypothetical protein
VLEASGRFIPPLGAKASALNFAGQVRGWAKHLAEWLKYADTLRVLEIEIASGIFTNGLNTFERVSARRINIGHLPAMIGDLTLECRLAVDVDMTPGATSVEVQLYDLTNSVIVAGTGLTSALVPNTHVESAPLVVGTSAGDLRSDDGTQYVLSLKMNGGVIPADSVSLTHAHILVTYS